MTRTRGRVACTHGSSQPRAHDSQTPPTSHAVRAGPVARTARVKRGVLGERRLRVVVTATTARLDVIMYNLKISSMHGMRRRRTLWVPQLPSFPAADLATRSPKAGALVGAAAWLRRGVGVYKRASAIHPLSGSSSLPTQHARVRLESSSDLPS